MDKDAKTSVKTSLNPSYNIDTGFTKIRQLSTGLVFERKPPDARDQVALGTFEYVPYDTPSVREILASKSNDALYAIGGQALRTTPIAGLPGREHFINDKLLPLFEAGILTIEALS